MTETSNWFHGKLSRQEAEEILKEDGFDEGLFLVRCSSSAVGDFVMSVVHKHEVIHYQIRRRQEDALFSLSEEARIIHGLDELVYYYHHVLANCLMVHPIHFQIFPPRVCCDVPLTHQWLLSVSLFPS